LFHQVKTEEPVKIRIHRKKRSKSTLTRSQREFIFWVVYGFVSMALWTEVWAGVGIQGIGHPILTLGFWIIQFIATAYIVKGER
jgi:hypothetical protein